MSKRKLTIVEYHSHGAGPQFITNRGEEATNEDTEPEETSGEESSGRARRLAPFIALGLVAGLAAAYRYLRSGSDSPTFESEQVEVTEYEN